MGIPRVNLGSACASLAVHFEIAVDAHIVVVLLCVKTRASTTVKNTFTKARVFEHLCFCLVFSRMNLTLEGKQ